MIRPHAPDLPANATADPVADPAQLATYRVLSVRQPHASLIISGRKWVENRTWRTRYRGPLLIHASGRTDPAEVAEWADELTAAGLPTTAADLPTGAIIGATIVADVVNLDDMPGRFDAGGQTQFAEDPLFGRLAHLLADDDAAIDYLCGPECWILDGCHMLPEPVPAKGRLNVWRHDLPAGLLPAEW